MRDLRVYLPTEDQCFIEGNAVTVKPRCAELLSAVMDVEPVAFRRGFYSVDIHTRSRVYRLKHVPVSAARVFWKVWLFMTSAACCLAAKAVRTSSPRSL